MEPCSLEEMYLYVLSLFNTINFVVLSYFMWLNYPQISNTLKNSINTTGLWFADKIIIVKCEWDIFYNIHLKEYICKFKKNMETYYSYFYNNEEQRYGLICLGIKNGYVKNEFYNDNIKNIEDNNYNNDVDFFVFKSFDNEEEIYNGYIIHSVDEVSDMYDIIHNDNRKPKKCDYKFMSVVLYIGDDEYEINMEKLVDYYMDGNILLDCKFLKYMISDKCDNIDILDSVDYTLSIMDHNVNQIELTKKEKILLSETSYNVIDVIDTQNDNDDSQTEESE